MNPSVKKTCLNRLNRLEGQIRGIARMIDDDRYCIDVITQLQAVKAALNRVEEEILKDHVAHCVEHAIRSRDAHEQRKKVNELMAVMSRAR